MPIFGGYWGYMAAPVYKVQEQFLVLKKRREIQARREADEQAEIEARQAEIERQRQ